jgi:hypothetical protein
MSPAEFNDGNDPPLQAKVSPEIMISERHLSFDAPFPFKLVRFAQSVPSRPEVAIHPRLFLG